MTLSRLKTMGIPKDGTRLPACLINPSQEGRKSVSYILQTGRLCLHVNVGDKLFLFPLLLPAVNADFHLSPSAIRGRAAMLTTHLNCPLLSIPSVLPVTYFLGKQNFLLDLLVKVSAGSVLSPPLLTLPCSCFLPV